MVRNPEDSPLAVIERCRRENRPVFVAGPMVRYSKLPFRELVRDYKVDIVYSPMILAREFVRNHNARASDFSTNHRDRPLIVQIGANNVTDLLRMIEMIHPYVDGVGLNCGCPIKDQVREGIGAALMSKKELVAEMVRAVKEKYGSEIVIETKIRVHSDIQETVEFVKLVEAAGVDFITVHGRTKNTRSSEPCDFDKIKTIKETVSVPVIANGDCRSLEDAYRIARDTGCDGVMAARGILNNPAMFAGYERAPWGAIEKFWNLSTAYGLPFRLIQHHLGCMLVGQISKQLQNELNSKSSLLELMDWFDANFELKRPTDTGFGTVVAVQYRQNRQKQAHI
ncbi:hypothetical protein KL930_001029 [Ogataea haglerorum]|uniref:tRNA-dihydrouridine synthase n=1 Tax=Ogataea haglerorum TaxID=1937702 RepID=A0AAN6DAH8_9ASCO|nr:hypothetical protein KL950_000456 [Ogataea haglerorum]KAG7730515.1 hypothetical protein KL933_000310 [Ogataea haglerorum]KAG7742693.1 hypothetical protein KL923_000308 [Ogataea haglerorum]KAG7745280.1 hypothetical protein KL932_000310 [Ogataea haglerorum]KAG7781167.1 hypothetical protein KL922_000089 [Ogataea haglerorum]